ncbi:unnamed protein product, partial [Vitis vinifera]|uniref:Uncharacterized protein n=1 Tax=Vitis vinifera TaxID=29760 RepID=D7TDL7_VITVI
MNITVIKLMSVEPNAVPCFELRNQFLMLWKPPSRLGLPKYNFQPDHCSTTAAFGVRKAVSRLGGSAAVIECSSQPQKKATSHHIKTHPRKTHYLLFKFNDNDKLFIIIILLF